MRSVILLPPFYPINTLLVVKNNRLKEGTATVTPHGIRGPEDKTVTRTCDDVCSIHREEQIQMRCQGSNSHNRHRRTIDA